MLEFMSYTYHVLPGLRSQKTGDFVHVDTEQRQTKRDHHGWIRRHDALHVVRHYLREYHLAW